MKKNPVIGICGATGLVGQEMLLTLESSQLQPAEVRIFASKNSAGEIFSFRGAEIAVEELTEDVFEGVDLALFATSDDISEKYIPIARESGAISIDNSSCFRLRPDVPLVVPEVNFASISASHKIIANPNCSTIQLVPVLHAINQRAGLKRVVVTTLQSVSGAGKAALDELWSQTLALFNQTELLVEVLPRQIAFNCVPQIDSMLEDGYTREENKIINESKKILGLPDLPITATGVRVPVFFGHAESVNIETQEDLSAEEAALVLNDMPGVKVYPIVSDYPLQINASGTDEIHVGRIRRDNSVPHGLNLWVVADNIRKGAAVNVLQIVELYLQKFT